MNSHYSQLYVASAALPVSLESVNEHDTRTVQSSCERHTHMTLSIFRRRTCRISAWQTTRRAPWRGCCCSVAFVMAQRKSMKPRRCLFQGARSMARNASARRDRVCFRARRRGRARPPHQCSEVDAIKLGRERDLHLRLSGKFLPTAAGLHRNKRKSPARRAYWPIRAVWMALVSGDTITTSISCSTRRVIA